MVKRLVLKKGYYDVNGYFYIDKDTGAGFLFDPGAQGKLLSDIIDENGWNVEKIIITHGHFDHIDGIKELRRYKNIPVFIHENGRQFLADPYYNLSAMAGVGEIRLSADGYFKDGDVIETADKGLSLRVIHTPGHTDDSCVFYSEKDGLAFTGDTIFKGTYGNYRFPTGNYETLMKTIKEKVLTLPPDTVLYSGHTVATTVAAERNMYN